MSKREIKFRAWDKERREMLQPEQLIHLEGNLTRGLSESSPFLIPMQYTGLKDSTGKEIWEGDILETTFVYPSGYAGGEKGFFGVAFYDIAFGGWYITTHQKSGNYDHEKTLQKATVKNFKVVGNIYEDSKLWKK